ncbi:glycerate kinase [Lentisphaerota bacterium ZTH]|nr:glycerate kinase [Lentisphaerota bacterium]WET05875.1 glycerate kinase [Lentisphaerota bacterium ZTH]
MKIIIAPDSYKGCMRSSDICKKIESGILQVLPDADIVKMPMADGGEGTVDAIVLSTGGSFKQLTVSGPLGNPVTATYGISGDGQKAVIEMAAASGIELLESHMLNPLKTSTFGTGELIRTIIAEGIRDITIGIGGSATVDGGAGMAQALGYRFLDADGTELPEKLGGGMLDRIAGIDASGVIPELKATRVRIASDVTNPLLGSNGAARIFGPQKGATSEMVGTLEANLKSFSELIIKSGFAADCSQSGDGAAGGLGFGLRTLCHAESVSGAGLVIELTGLNEQLADADLLITGEGCTDSQTADGKLCAVIAAAASQAKVPAVLVSGALKGDLSGLDNRFTAMLSTTALPCNLEAAMQQTPENLLRQGRNIAALITALQ